MKTEARQEILNDNYPHAMITRRLALRHGRIALAKPPTPSWRRALATAVDQQTSSLPRADPSTIDLPSPQHSSISKSSQAVSRRSQPEYDPKWGRFAHDYYESQDYRRKTRSLGTDLTPHYKPHLMISRPPSPADITLEALMAAQSHLGHATGLWHPANSRYIYGIRSGIHIISLDATASHLRRAAKIVRSTTAEGGLVLFVGTRDGQSQSVVRAAELSGGCHLFDRWIPGSITNAHQILANCRMIVKDANDNEVTGFEDQLGKHRALKPDLVVVLNPLENYVLLRECRQHNIPTIGVVDTDCNPTWVTYPIPANDDSRRCTNFIAGVLGRAGEEGKNRRLEFTQLHGAVPYEQGHELSATGTAEDGEEGDVRAHPTPYEQQEEQKLDKINASRLATAASADGLLGPLDHLDEQRFLAAYSIADLSDFDDLGLEIFATDLTSDSPANQEITEAQLEEAEAALQEVGLGLDAESKGLVNIAMHELDPAQGEQLEQLAVEYQEEQITDEEAAELIRMADEMRAQGRSVDVPSVQDSTGAALRKIKEAEDPALARLIAVKRRALGEKLSEVDREVLKGVEEEEREVTKRVDADRLEMKKGLDEMKRYADEQAKEMVGEEVEGENAEGRRAAGERERSRTAHMDDEVDIGPVRKTRKGRPGGEE
ncbi:37S ribosomal protein MRP4, mitochondrial [Elsinoe australis]|uniref:37S ribosomal protein MRP4, mitochondrial n=1 Tax=Elsinoe australis TaxID=40998 RepID=A0A2P7ZQ63_9PEZI|nr:37S ribosomal protein MRP4, mitochondrial [Elsinoe australis]